MFTLTRSRKRQPKSPFLVIGLQGYQPRGLAQAASKTEESLAALDPKRKPLAILTFTVPDAFVFAFIDFA